MGALPDREPPVGAPRRDPEQAPPLAAVSGRTPAESETAPTGASDSGPEQPAAGETEPVPETTHEAEDADEDLPPSWWERLRPPQVWDCPAPTLRQEIAWARQGEHLPETGPWRRAEMARTWVSALINSALLFVVHINRSAARQAVAALFVLALFLLIT